ncbi:MAG: DUF5674 family protein [bacterium]
MELVKKAIIKDYLREVAQNKFGDLVKAVVDIEKGIMAIDAELHADQEAYLLENGSKQKNLWGINLYPAKKGDDFIEFDSMINLRPAQGNRTRGVESKEIQEKIREVVKKLVR